MAFSLKNNEKTTIFVSFYVTFTSTEPYHI